MTPKKRRALKRSFYASISKLIGVGLGAGAGSLLYQMIGGGFKGWPVALGMAAISFALTWFAEFEREIE